MQLYLKFLIVSSLSILLILGQSMWAGFIKKSHPFDGTMKEALLLFAKSPTVWMGLLFYVLATGLYFFLLSKYKFFSLQLSMTALAILLSTLVSVFLFHEKLSSLNMAGLAAILAGIFMVFAK